ncbi:hypothetical protein GH714_039724 [Hevea brasiliensis]|uniref:Uncharacterized protein n=1 Tax=Hevea brasiliensis TaxID=3981 RepID=A0A6A6KHH1_HEVBR|nr:hypothetical protein GH714_039724 [Hevea brasiliensis]
MKISSKSILSPGRAREPSQISLSNSLSRRLRTNGSMKGGQASPMFPTNGKKRGCAFENPEPSSPKVTCIGQVRVKTKKQGKKFRTRSQRRGEVSFRRVDQTSTSNSSNIEASNHQDFTHNHANNQFLNQQQQQECLPHRNQRWVHLPLTICEALRAFGAEFNCFLPCRSSCMASEKEKEDKAAGSSNSSSCGAVFARWLVAVQEGDEKGREIELVVGEEEEDREDREDGEDCQESSTEILCVKEGNLEEQEEKTEIQVNQQQETLLDDSSPSREETEDPEYLKDDENEEELLQESRDNLERRLSRAEDDEQERNFSDDNVSVHQKESKEAGQDLVEDQESNQQRLLEL